MTSGVLTVRLVLLDVFGVEDHSQPPIVMSNIIGKVSDVVLNRDPACGRTRRVDCFTLPGLAGRGEYSGNYDEARKTTFLICFRCRGGSAGRLVGLAEPSGLDAT